MAAPYPRLPEAGGLNKVRCHPKNRNDAGGGIARLPCGRQAIAGLGSFLCPLQTAATYRYRCRLRPYRPTIRSFRQTAFAAMDSVRSECRRCRETCKQISQLPSGGSFKVGFHNPGPMWFAVPKFAVMFPDLELQSQLYRTDADESKLLDSLCYDLLVTAAAPQDNGLIYEDFIRNRLPLSVMKGKLLRYTGKSFPTRLSGCQAHPVSGRRRVSTPKPSPPIAVESHIRLLRFDDFFLFRQHLRHTRSATPNTEIVPHHRDDGNNRRLIPLPFPKPKSLTSWHFCRKTHKESPRCCSGWRSPSHKPFTRNSKLLSAGYLTLLRLPESSKPFGFGRALANLGPLLPPLAAGTARRPGRRHTISQAGRTNTSVGDQG